jgi:DNA-binding XRE family transcriptional regulator
MVNHAVPNHKNSRPFVINPRISRYPDRTLGERLKKCRLERGLFQVDLAKRVGVSEMTIVNWKTGKTKPRKKNLEKLKTILRA